MRALKFLILFWNTLIITSLSAQYGYLDLKEDYDIYNTEVLKRTMEGYSLCNIPADIEANNDPDGACSDMDACFYGHAFSKVLDGLITMYQTTGDKAYLYKFMARALCVMENRHDVQGVTTAPRWVVEEDNQAFMDGLIVSGLSRFGYIIKNNPNLYNEPLYPFSKLNPQNYSPHSCHCNYTGINFSTFGDFANWLDLRIEETLQWYINTGFWSSTQGMKKHPSDNNGMAINKQGPFGRAFLFNGLTTNSAFLVNAGELANLYKGLVTIDDICEEIFYQHPVLRTINGGYWWYLRGWRVEYKDCAQGLTFYNNVPDLVGYTENLEDISHAVVTVQFAIDAYNKLPPSFSLLDMVKFRNMATNNLYDEYSDGTSLIHNAVNGDDNPIFRESGACSSGVCPADAPGLRNNYLNFIRLCQFDDASMGPSQDVFVYNSVLKFYEESLSGYGGLPPNYSPQQNMGHSEAVMAQWTVECPNLTLYNRNVVYDQDFFSKNILTVAPEENQFTQYSYADPIISDPTFTVETGITSEMTAPEEIVLKTGFHAKAGCSFTARIDDQLCGGGQKNLAFDGGGVNQHGGASDFSEKETSKPRTNSELVLKLFPNPMKDEGTIHVRTPSEVEITLKLKDNYGRDVLLLSDKKRIRGVYNETLSTSSLKPGVYFLALTINNEQVKTEKLVVVR